MIWFWLFFGVFSLFIVYCILLLAKPRHIIRGFVIALAVAGLVGTVYLVANGKSQWIWATLSGFLPWISRIFFMRKLFKQWKKDTVSKFTSRHLSLTIPHNHSLPDGILLQPISIDETLTLQAQTSLSAIDEQSLDKLHHYLHQHDGEAFYLLAYYGSISGRILTPYHLEETLDFSPEHQHITTSQAQEILGLSSHPSAALIHKAHQRLSQELKPPHGNSYLLDRINAARDALLRQ